MVAWEGQSLATGDFSEAVAQGHHPEEEEEKKTSGREGDYVFRWWWCLGALSQQRSEYSGVLLGQSTQKDNSGS